MIVKEKIIKFYIEILLGKSLVNPIWFNQWIGRIRQSKARLREMKYVE